MYPKKSNLPSLSELDKISIQGTFRPLGVKSIPLASPHTRNLSRNQQPRNPVYERSESNSISQSPNKSISGLAGKIPIQIQEVLQAGDSKIGKDPIVFQSKVEKYGLENRGLKKLYTETMYKQFSNKLDSLRTKYKKAYNNATHASNVDVDVEREKIKDLVLKSENMFQTTYSIKYFGLNQDQIGILSKRVAISHKLTARHNDTAERSKNYTNGFRSKPHTSRMSNHFVKEIEGDFDVDDNHNNVIIQESYIGHRESLGKQNEMLIQDGKKTLKAINNQAKPIQANEVYEYQTQPELYQEEDEPIKIIQETSSFRIRDKPATTRLNYTTEDLRLQGITKEEETASIPRNSVGHEKKYNSHSYGKSLGQQSGKKILKGEEEDYDDILDDETNRTAKTVNNSNGVSPKIYERNKHKSICDETSKDAMNSCGPGTPQGYVVTKYFLPKKLQSSRKQEIIEKTSKKLVGLQQSAKGVSETNVINFERITKTLPKVKRNMLRNVSVPVEEEYKDDLNALDQYKSYEMRALTSNVTKYSYSKLLNKINLDTKIEDLARQNNQMLETMIKKRRQRIQGHRFDSGDFGRAITNKTSPKISVYNGDLSDVEQLYVGSKKPVIKIDRLVDNEMYTTLTRIKKQL